MNLTIEEFLSCNKTDKFQIESAKYFQTLLNFKSVKVVSTHISKSIILPVFKFEEHNYSLYVRDNFHDINAIYVSNKNCHCRDIPYVYIWVPKTERWYQKEKQKSIEYNQKDPNFNSLLYEDLSWYEKWSGSNLIKEDDMYFHDGYGKCFFQGMTNLDLPKDAYESYRHGKNNFSLSFDDWSSLMYRTSLINGFIAAIK